MKTIVDILTESLIGKTIRVYEYDSIHNHTNDRVRHYYAENTQSVKDIYFDKNRGAWSDVKVNEIEVEIVGVNGQHMEYEGNFVGVMIQLLDGERYVDLKVDEKIKFV